MTFLAQRLTRTAGGEGGCGGGGEEGEGGGGGEGAAGEGGHGVVASLWFCFSTC